MWPSIWFLLGTFCTAKTDQSFENTLVKINSNLDTHDVRQQIVIKAVATQSSDIYRLAIPTDLTEHLSLLQVYSKSEELKVEKQETIKETSYYDVHLPKKAKQGDSIELTTKMILVKVAKPFPSVLNQFDSNQMYDFYGNVFFYSPYPTKDQSHTIKYFRLIRLPKPKEPKEYTKDVTVKFSGRELNYGPFKDTKPLSAHILRVHFFNNKAALVVKKYEKTIKVAYLRPLLHIQEDFELVHEGAKLKGFFSQVDYKLNSYLLEQTNVVRRLQSVIPSTSTEVYFKDIVGNVSTSNLRYESKKAVLDLRPRYPLYGGWKYSWFHGYTIPQSPYLEKVGMEDYTISLTLTPSIKGLLVEKGRLKVILPEGASNIRVETQYGAKVTQQQTFTYLDTTGRPTVVIEKTNIVDEFDKKIKITYKYPWIFVFQKPAVVFAVVVGLISVVWFVSSLDLSIVEDPKKKMNAKVKALQQQVSMLLNKEKAALAKIGKAFLEYKSDKNISKFKETQKNVFTIVESCHSTLAEIANGPGQDLLEFQKKVKQLLAVLKERSQLIKKHQDQVMAHFELEAKGGVADDKRQKLSQTLADNEAKLEELQEKIQKLQK